MKGGETLWIIKGTIDDTPTQPVSRFLLFLPAVVHVWVAVLLPILTHTHILVFAVVVRLLCYRVDDRREDVQHEDHGRHQARHEKNCSRTGSPAAQKPRAERGSRGGV